MCYAVAELQLICDQESEFWISSPQIIKCWLVFVMSGNEFVRPTSERLVGSSLNFVFLVYLILACMPVRREEHSWLLFSYICFPGLVILVLLSRYFTNLHYYLNCLNPASKGFAIISRHVCFLQLFMICIYFEGINCCRVSSHSPKLTSFVACICFLIFRRRDARNI